MSVLSHLYDKGVNCYSPVMEETQMVIKCDKKGNEIIVWEPVDCSKIIASNGTADMWSLNSLLAAGINPNFGVKTGYNTRLEGVDAIDEIVATIDKLEDINE